MRVALTKPENPLPTEIEVQRVFDHLNMVKHSFVRLSLDPDWIDRRMSIDVNELLMVSFDGGNWHGKAVHTHNVVNGEGGLWTLSFNHRADLARLKDEIFKQVRNTNNYLAADGNNYRYNAILIPKTMS